jgi:hypothetical protein
VKEAVRCLAQYLCIGVFVSGLSGLGCAGIPQREQKMPGELCAVQQQFAAGQYRQSLQGCQSIIASRPGCPPLDEALYYAALNCLRMNSDESGKLQAVQHFKRLIDECPKSSLLPEAEVWLAALKPPPEKTGKGHAPPGVDAGSAPSGHEVSLRHELKKKDQEIKRLHSEIIHLNREIGLLKNVDVQLNEQKKDLDNGPDEGKDTRP